MGNGAACLIKVFPFRSPSGGVVLRPERVRVIVGAGVDDSNAVWQMSGAYLVWFPNHWYVFYRNEEIPVDESTKTNKNQLDSGDAKQVREPTQVSRRVSIRALLTLLKLCRGKFAKV